MSVCQDFDDIITEAEELIDKEEYELCYAIAALVLINCAKMADTDFDLQGEIDRYTHKLCSGIHRKRRREEVCREYREHMEDEIYRLTLSGMSEAKAFKIACVDLGDPSDLRQILGGVHNRLPMDFLKNVALILLRLLAVWLFYEVTHSYIVGKGWGYPWFMYATLADKYQKRIQVAFLESALSLV